MDRARASTEGAEAEAIAAGIAMARAVGASRLAEAGRIVVAVARAGRAAAGYADC